MSYQVRPRNRLRASGRCQQSAGLSESAHEAIGDRCGALIFWLTVALPQRDPDVLVRHLWYWSRVAAYRWVAGSAGCWRLTWITGCSRSWSGCRVLCLAVAQLVVRVDAMLRVGRSKEW